LSREAVNSPVSRFVGVDGCPGGWFAAGIDEDGSGRGADHGLYAEFDGVLSAYPDAERLLVDIPIGLPDAGRRDCDVAARERLGSRASTVFFAPCRAVLDATDHETASAINRERTGYGLSIQAWHLVPRIRAVDVAVRSSPGDGRVLEAHPELCFAALGDGPVSEPKSTAAGRSERLDRLRPVLTDIDGVYEACLSAYHRRDVARDDVLDALVLAVAAARPLARVPDVAPGAVPRDRTGLPMEIRFPSKTSFDTR
jgi:predicted RNase H-like nuclease